jgi:hypothetical protein
VRELAPSVGQVRSPWQVLPLGFVSLENYLLASCLLASCLSAFCLLDSCPLASLLLDTQLPCVAGLRPWAAGSCVSRFGVFVHGLLSRGSASASGWAMGHGVCIVFPVRCKAQMTTNCDLQFVFGLTPLGLQPPDLRCSCRLVQDSSRLVQEQFTLAMSSRD